MLIVEVEWYDATANFHELPNEEIKKIKPIFTYSAGKVVEQTDDFITLCLMNFVELDGGKLTVTIPKGAIKRIATLKDTDKKQRKIGFKLK